MWKKQIENSDVFMLKIINDINCTSKTVEQVLYAKSLNKPFVILIKEGIEISVPDLFEECTIISKEYFTKENFVEVYETTKEKIRNYIQGESIE